MATKILIIGNSGTGKSTSLRTLPPEQTQIIRVVNKNLPFRESAFKIVDTDDYAKIKTALVQSPLPICVIDDVQYLLANEFMRRATEKGFEKFTELARNFWDLLNTIDKLPNNKTVYLLSHLETDGDREKFKTIGKLLDEKITIEGLFTIVLKSGVEITGDDKNRYIFHTQNNGKDTVKSPIGLFEDARIDNDLWMIDKKIREYYGIELDDAKVSTPPYSEETDKFLSMIRNAKTKESLQEIGARIKESTLPETQKEIIRSVYKNKVTEL